MVLAQGALNAPLGRAGVFTCAWHDAQADLTDLRAGSDKTPTVTGQKGNADKARAGLLFEWLLK